MSTSTRLVYVDYQVNPLIVVDAYNYRVTVRHCTKVNCSCLHTIYIRMTGTYMKSRQVKSESRRVQST